MVRQQGGVLQKWVIVFVVYVAQYEDSMFFCHESGEFREQSQHLSVFLGVEVNVTNATLKSHYESCRKHSSFYMSYNYFLMLHS